MIKWFKKLLLRRKVAAVVKAKRKYVMPEGMKDIVEHLSEEMVKAEDFIKSKREEFFTQISQKVYYFNTQARYRSINECECSYTIELKKNQAEYMNASIPSSDDPHLYAEVELLPYTVCDVCRDKLKKDAKPLRSIVSALKDGTLKIHTADSLRLKLEQKLLERDDETDE